MENIFSPPEEGQGNDLTLSFKESKSSAKRWKKENNQVFLNFSGFLIIEF